MRSITCAALLLVVGCGDARRPQETPEPVPVRGVEPATTPSERADEAEPSERDRVLEALRISSAHYRRAAWGAEPDDAERASEEERFRCAWDALARAGLDPASELACLARRRESVARCFESGSPQDTDHTRACLADLDAICAFSPGYEGAIAECPRENEE